MSVDWGKTVSGESMGEKAEQREIREPAGNGKCYSSR